MAWLFLRLKFRLVANAVGGRGAWSVVTLVLVWGAAAVAGLALGAVVAAAMINVPRPGVTAVAVAVVIHAAWVIVPVLAASMDSTLDPRAFETLPLRPRELAGGMLAASAAGPGGLLTSLVVGVGLGGGSRPGWAGVVTVPVLTLLLTATAVVTGRLVTTVLADVLRSSKASEIIPAVAAVLGIAAVLFISSPLSDLVGLVESGLPPGLVYLQAVPSGAVGAAFVSFSGGAQGLAILQAGWGLLGMLGLTWAYGRALARSHARTPSPAVGRVRAGSDLLGARLAGLFRSGPVRVAAAKELRYLRRDPRLRAQLFGGLVTVVVISFAASVSFTTPYAPFVAVLTTWAVVAGVVPNQFGVDGGSFWAYAVTPTDVSTVLVGKNVAWAVLAVPVAVVSALVGAVLASDLTFVPSALIGSAATFLIWLAVGNVTSIYGAFPIPERQPFGSNSMGSGHVLIVSLAGLAVSSALSGPLAAAVVVAVVFGGPGWAVVAAFGGVLYALAIYRFTYRWSRSLVRERLLLLVAALDRA